MAFVSQAARGQMAEPAGAAPPTAAPVSPPGPQVVHRQRTELVIAGAVVFGLSWLPAVLVSAKGRGGCDDQDCRDHLTRLAIPVYGPWQVGGQQSNPALFVLWGLAQAGGLAMVVAGLIGHDVPADVNKPTVAITPMASQSSAGIIFHAPF